MTRVKGGTVSKTRRRKVLKRAKGYFGSKHRLYKTAQEQLFHSGAYSFNDRKKRANDFRKLWITRINAACRNNDIVYSKLTVAELKDLCAQKGIDTANMKKADLVAALEK